MSDNAATLVKVEETDADPGAVVGRKSILYRVSDLPLPTLSTEEYKYQNPHTRTLSRVRLGVQCTLSYQYLSVYIAALADPYKTHCGPLPPGY